MQFIGNYWLILLACTLGAAAIYLMLPQPRGARPILGGLVGGAALVLAGIYLVQTETVWVETLLFYAFAGLAILGGCLLICQSNPVHAALSFALVVLSTCGLFLLQAAPFLMAATIIVYAGAIVVTFLFVIMLAQQAGLSNADRRSREPFLATVAGFILLAAILGVLHKTYATTHLDALLQQTRRAANATSVDELQAAVNPPTFVEDFLKVVDEKNGLQTAGGSLDGLRADLAAAVRNLEQPLWKLTKTPDRFDDADLQAAREQMKTVYTLGRQVRKHQGSLAAKHAPPFSNPRVATADEKGLPVRNVNALGRALFAQHLLSVELAGVLLLVASIGAIAIAGRRSEVLR